MMLPVYLSGWLNVSIVLFRPVPLAASMFDFWSRFTESRQLVNMKQSTPFRAVSWSLAALVVSAVGHIAPASARVACGQGTVRGAFDGATVVFVGRVEAPPTVAEALPPNTRGIPDMNQQIVIQRVFKGDISPGETISVHWRGFSEPVGGPSIGGCSVPGMRETQRFPFRVVVFAQQNEDGTYVVRNNDRSGHFRLGQDGRRLLRRLGRLRRGLHRG